jgi:hypothetical protein
MLHCHMRMVYSDLCFHVVEFTVKGKGWEGLYFKGGVEAGWYGEWMLSFLPSYDATAKIGPWPPLLSFFQSHTMRHMVGLPGRMISPSQRPLPTQNNTTYKHKRQTSIPSAGFEPTIPATKRPQTYALDRAGILSLVRGILLYEYYLNYRIIAIYI